MNADPHHTRKHDIWSASATAANVVCAGRIAMLTMCEERESEAAAWGTCAHQLSERCFRQQKDAIEFLGDIEKSGKFEFPIDEEMCRTSQTYVDYVLTAYTPGQGWHFWIEQNFSLAPLGAALEAGGTADAVIYDPDQQQLEVVDLKGGRGVVVDVKGNPQGRTYAIGALLAFPELKIKTVKVTIVQPRVGNGEPKSEMFHVTELLDWVVDLLPMIQRAKDALDEFNALGANRVLFDAWAEKWLKTGQCTFCDAQAICPKRRQEALANLPKIAREWHEDVTMKTPLDLTNLAQIGSPEELAHDLDGFEAIEDWIKARRAHAHSLAEKGTTIPGYQLADKIGNRAWVDEVKASEALAVLGLTEKQMFESKFRSPAQMEKVLGKRKAEIEPLVERPIRGSNLVSVNKTTRPAAKTVAERFHEQM